MTTAHDNAVLLADGVDDLAVPAADHDLSHEFVMSRLDDALTRVAKRLSGKVSQRTQAQLDDAAEVMRLLPQDARRQVVSHPYFMYWMVKQYERCAAGDRTGLEEAMPDIGRFVLLPAVQHGVWPDRPATLPVRDGAVRFPGFTRHVLVPKGTADGTADVWLDGADLRFAAPGCDIRVPVAELLGTDLIGGGSPVAQRPVIPGTNIEVDGTDPFVGDLYASMNDRPPMPGYPPRDLAPMPYVSEETLNNLSEACALISWAWPNAGRELLRYTRLYVPFVSRCFSTFTEAAFPGAVFMGEVRHPFSDVMYTAEHLLHEHSHVRLCLIMEQDPVFHGDPNALVSSPWRRDPRPLLGIVQGAFVFARVARFLRYAHQLSGEARYATRRVDVVADVVAALEVLRAEQVRFTPLGQALVEQFEAETRTAVDEDGPR